jgi:GxxExxY protein
MDEEEISKQVVDAAVKVHNALGPGLLESAYESALAYELVKRGMRVNRQVIIPIFYDQLEIDEGFRADIVVNDLVIIELKSVESLQSIHFKQMLTYLKMSKKKLGFLLNFNSNLMKDGIKRIVNGL